MMLRLVLFLSGLASMKALISASSPIVMWVCGEILLMIYIGVATTPGSCMCVCYYFVIQSVGSIMFIGGLIWTFPLMILGGLCVKLGVVPFHFWVAPSSEGVSWAMLPILLGWQKLAPVLVLSSLPLGMDSGMLLLGSISSLLGAIGGVSCSSIKSTLAWSSVSQVGWIICLCASSCNVCLFYLIVYFFNLFPVGVVMHGAGSKADSVLLLLMFSMAGVPPLPGFMAKLLALVVLLDSAGLHIILILLLSSFLSMGMYMKILVQFVGCGGFILRSGTSVVLVLMVCVSFSIYYFYMSGFNVGIEKCVWDIVDIYGIG